MEPILSLSTLCLAVYSLSAVLTIVGFVVEVKLGTKKPTAGIVILAVGFVLLVMALVMTVAGYLNVIYTGKGF